MNAEPRWLEIADSLELHDYVIQRTGRAAGVRDLGLLESALAKPVDRHLYEDVDDLTVLAAAYALACLEIIPLSTQ